MSVETNSLAGDLLFGAQAIADYIGESNRKKIYYHAAAGNLPIIKMGAALVASKKKLREHFERVDLTPKVAEAVNAALSSRPRSSRRRSRAEHDRATA